jgi:hypothetical protein
MREEISGTGERAVSRPVPLARQRLILFISVQDWIAR